jgi:SAM-dependent methyltransferase
MTGPKSIIQADFDRIALLSEEGWNHNQHYHRFLLRHVPASCREALEIGCGAGAFSRLLAERCDRVLALDLSPCMIQVARERSQGYPNIEYQCVDVTTWPFPANRFACIVTIATLHHLPLEETLLAMKNALRVGGMLLVLDLFRTQGLIDTLIAAMGLPANLALRLLKRGCLREPLEIRQAWQEHGKHDHYLTLAQARGACARLLPGAQVRRHLLWRYSIIWRKTA